jgi:ElaB/YqjD/DUF883 family membrane-anchored ribosome-binding protein
MNSRVQPNPISRDAQAVVNEAQELLKTVRDEGASKLGEFQASMQQGAKAAMTTVQDGAKVAMTTTDTYVRDNPWRAVGIAAAAGAIVGFLASRR